MYPLLLDGIHLARGTNNDPVEEWRITLIDRVWKAVLLSGLPVRLGEHSLTDNVYLFQKANECPAFCDVLALSRTKFCLRRKGQLAETLADTIVDPLWSCDSLRIPEGQRSDYANKLREGYVLNKIPEYERDLTSGLLKIDALLKGRINRKRMIDGKQPEKSLSARLLDVIRRLKSGPEWTQPISSLASTKLETAMTSLNRKQDAGSFSGAQLVDRRSCLLEEVESECNILDCNDASATAWARAAIIQMSGEFCAELYGTTPYSCDSFFSDEYNDEQCMRQFLNLIHGPDDGTKFDILARRDVETTAGVLDSVEWGDIKRLMKSDQYQNTINSGKNPTTEYYDWVGEMLAKPIVNRKAETLSYVMGDVAGCLIGAIAATFTFGTLSGLAGTWGANQVRRLSETAIKYVGNTIWRPSLYGRISHALESIGSPNKSLND